MRIQRAAARDTLSIFSGGAVVAMTAEEMEVEDMGAAASTAGVMTIEEVTVAVGMTAGGMAPVGLTTATSIIPEDAGAAANTRIEMEAGGVSMR